MPRDYAKKQSSCSNSSVPGWIWLTAGLLVGLFIAFLVYLNKQPGNGDLVHKTIEEAKRVVTRPDRERAHDARGVRKTPAKSEAPAKPEPKTTDQPAKQAKLNFDFYKVLPEFEVSVPEDTHSGAPGDNDKEGNTQESKTAPPKTVEVPGVYMLQAGSFRHLKDADARKAQLALLGIVSKIQKVSINGKETWHRVQVGPYKDLDRLNRTRRLLKENGIEHMLLKQRS